MRLPEQERVSFQQLTERDPANVSLTPGSAARTRIRSKEGWNTKANLVSLSETSDLTYSLCIVHLQKFMLTSQDPRQLTASNQDTRGVWPMPVHQASSWPLSLYCDSEWKLSFRSVPRGWSCLSWWKYGWLFEPLSWRLCASQTLHAH